MALEAVRPGMIRSRITNGRSGPWTMPGTRVGSMATPTPPVPVVALVMLVTALTGRRATPRPLRASASKSSLSDNCSPSDLAPAGSLAEKRRASFCSTSCRRSCRPSPLFTRPSRTVLVSPWILPNSLISALAFSAKALISASRSSSACMTDFSSSWSSARSLRSIRRCSARAALLIAFCMW
ncbi:hypothetical protein D9M70_496020 [compost metagenome]